MAALHGVKGGAPPPVFFSLPLVFSLPRLKLLGNCIINTKFVFFDKNGGAFSGDNTKVYFQVNDITKLYYQLFVFSGDNTKLYFRVNNDTEVYFR